MNRNKCPQCGLVNSAADLSCRRCSALLTEEEGGTNVEEPSLVDGTEEATQKRRPAVRITWILGTTLVLVFAAYLSLLLTSSDLEFDRRQAVRNAIAILEQRGFARQAFVLNNLVKYRGNDNWWNRYLGHHNAYAATNFPFEIVTLYPEFFDVAVDDTERAAILLHESYHLFGSGEEKALEGVWRQKQRIGWTADKYSRTKLWNNTREETAAALPRLFSCGTDGHSDCVE